MKKKSRKQNWDEKKGILQDSGKYTKEIILPALCIY
jgi:hypothetical protein